MSPARGPRYFLRCHANGEAWGLVRQDGRQVDYLDGWGAWRPGDRRLLAGATPVDAERAAEFADRLGLVVDLAEPADAPAP